MLEINWLSQPLAATAALVIGAIWYGPLFQKAWMKNGNISMESIKNGYHPAVLYSLAWILAFVSSIGLKLFVVDIHKAFDSVSDYPFWHGAYHGTTIAILFGAIPVLITNALFNQRNWKFILINVGYWLLTFAVMGGIIGAL